MAELEKVNKANVSARLKEIKTTSAAKDETAVLHKWLKLNTKETDLKKRVKTAETELDAKVYAHYDGLGEDEIKSLVVDDKWMTTIEAILLGRWTASVKY